MPEAETKRTCLVAYDHFCDLELKKRGAMEQWSRACGGGIMIWPTLVFVDSVGDLIILHRALSEQ